jgi:hypothetical protein
MGEETYDWLVPLGIAVGGGLLLALGLATVVGGSLRARSDVARIAVEIAGVTLVGAAADAVPCYIQGQALAQVPLSRIGSFRGLFPLPLTIAYQGADWLRERGVAQLPTAALGFGLGSALGLGMGLAVQHRDRPRGMAGLSIVYQAGLPALAFLLVLLFGSVSIEAFGPGGTYVGPASSWPGDLQYTIGSLGPDIVRQLTASATSQFALGMLVGAGTGLVIGYTCGLIVDFFGGMLGLLGFGVAGAATKSTATLPVACVLRRVWSLFPGGDRGASGISDAAYNGDDSDSDETAVRVSLYSGILTPVAFWLAVLVVILLSVFINFGYHWGDNDGKMWPIFVFVAHVFNLIVLLILVTVVVAAIGIINAAASAIVNTGQTIKSAMDTTTWGFDWYNLVGGVLLGLVLAFGAYVPLLNLLVRLIGTSGWYGLAFGVLIGVLLSFGPLLRRGIDALPTLAVLIAGGVLAAGGVIALIAALVVSRT